MNEWGCPEWDSEDYPRTGTLAQWKWEFLRRDPKYRKAWDRAEDCPYLVPEIRALSRSADQQDLLYIMTVLRNSLSVLKPSASFHELWQAAQTNNLADRNARSPLLSRVSVDDWRKRFEGNPVIDEEHILNSYINVNSALWIKERHGMVSVAMFDHTRPLPEQIAKVTALVKERHKALSHPIEDLRKKPEYWARHLRVIDARDQGAASSDVYEYFADKIAGDDEEAKDKFYPDGTVPSKIVHAWYTEAMNALSKVTRLT
jgi:hypothetical protein